MKRHVAAILRAFFGRRLLGRIGRYLWYAARLDGLGDRFEINGEAGVQDAFVRDSSPDPLVVLDVGANVGRWSQSLVERCARARRGLTLHAFEPSRSTFETLQRNAAGWGGDAKVAIHRLAMSNRIGTAEFHSVGDRAGRNSLHEIRGQSRSTESVELTTLDAFAAEHGLGRIDLVKVDAEGHDFFVVQGARKLLEEGRVRALQFEYNWRWIDSRSYLRDLFDFLEGTPYALGKVTPQGIEYYSGWEPSLESYVGGNYLITRKGAEPPLPLVTAIHW